MKMRGKEPRTLEQSTLPQRGPGRSLGHGEQGKDGQWVWGEGRALWPG